jgi:hypothetical protein
MKKLVKVKKIVMYSFIKKVKCAFTCDLNSKVAFQKHFLKILICDLHFYPS